VSGKIYNKEIVFESIIFAQPLGPAMPGSTPLDILFLVDISGPGSQMNAEVYGPPLYTGSNTNPTFLVKTFTNLIGNSGNGAPPYGYGFEQLTVTSTPSVSAAPEPSAWALMIAGLALIGVALRVVRQGVISTKWLSTKNMRA
jgi:hypothetical protein